MRSKVTSIFIDGSNLYASIKALGLSAIDYKKILSHFDGTIHKALYFTALPPKEEQSSLRPMVDYLEYNGWGVIQKEWKQFVDPVTKAMKTKGNMDVELTTMALELASYCSDVVLFTGDGDFRFLVETLQRRYGIRVTVVSTIATRPAMIADELRRQADTFIDIVDLHPKIKQTGPDKAQQELKARRFKFAHGGDNGQG
jgi:uncharacterized LabA/DUF88 family protein